MLVRLLVVLVVVMLMVTQEQVDTPSGHGALVCSHALPILERSLVMCHHSPPRSCNRGTVTMPAAACASSDLQTLALQLHVWIDWWIGVVWVDECGLESVGWCRVD
jgi:hypothetical protein